MLVSGSIYQACRFFELFDQTDLAGKCAIVTSYKPSPAELKGEESGEGLTEKLRQYGIYRKMLADWFNEAPETGQQSRRIREGGEKEVHRGTGSDEAPDCGGQVLTGFDAPPGHLSLHRQTDARPRPIPGHLPRESAGRR
jgi:type I restriction enzyme R subunit